MRRVIRTTARVLLLLIAAVFIAAGVMYSRRVYDEDELSREFGLMTFNRIPDWQLTIDATFTGVVRKGDKLFSTYNRLESRGKRACPT